MEKEPIQKLIKQCSMGLFDLACKVSGCSTWDLTLPVGVIDARRKRPKLTVTAVGTINSVVRASSTIGHPLMQRLFERMESVGPEQALEEANNGDEAETFGEIWQAYKEERTQSGQALWSIEDATTFVLHSKAAHAKREVALVAILPGHPQDIVMLSVPIAFLTQG